MAVSNNENIIIIFFSAAFKKENEFSPFFFHCIIY